MNYTFVISVVGTDATRFFFQLMLYSTSSFLDPKLSPLSRVYRIWFVAFGLRCWRSWIVENLSYTLEHDFVSSNVYLCVEINANSLVMILIRLKRENKAHLLLPWLFGNQSAENFFRLLRSLSPMESTRVNVTSAECSDWKCRKADAALLLSSRVRDFFYRNCGYTVLTPQTFRNIT